MTANLKGKGFAEVLQAFFPELHGARRKFLEKMIPALAKASSVVLRRVASAFESRAKEDSVVRRIQRFLAKEDILDRKSQARLIVHLLGIEGPMTIAIDRTNWKFGQKAINVLMLSVQWQGKAIPLLWELLEKEGSSSQEERIDLLGLFIEIFGAQSIYNLTADREFIGQEWFKWLIEHQIPFDIRIKSNTLVTRNGKTCAAWKLFRNTRRGQMRRCNGLFTVYNNRVYLSGGLASNKKGQDDFCIIASYCNQAKAGKRYALRWKIEQLFKELKTGGFCLEDTQITSPERLGRLLGLVAIAYCWIVKTGEQVAVQVPRLTRKLKHGRPRYNIFCIGLDAVRKAFWSLDRKQIQYVMRFLSCT